MSKSPDGGLGASYAHNRRGAERRGLAWELNRDAYKVLVQQDCFYCGIPAQTDNPRMAPRVGIDRIDNDLGYVDGNVVPCCMDCNRMKSVFTLDHFYAKIGLISREHTVEIRAALLARQLCHED